MMFRGSTYVVNLCSQPVQEFQRTSVGRLHAPKGDERRAQENLQGGRLAAGAARRRRRAVLPGRPPLPAAPVSGALRLLRGLPMVKKVSL